MNQTKTSNRTLLTKVFLASALSFTLANTTFASDIPHYKDKEVFFGELHLHTTYSLDAYLGMTRLSPDDAYRFAQGQPMPIPGGMARLHKPLDFAAVTDHAEFYGESYVSLNPESPLYNDPMAVKIRNESKDEKTATDVFVAIVQGANRNGTQSDLGKKAGPEARAAAWKIIQSATDANYKPGVFTTLHGFEWSSAPKGNNLHRNIIFRDTKVPEVPFSALDSNEPEKLWQELAKYEKNGATLLAIPHNSNFSGGLMFSDHTLAGKPIDKAWAETRAHFEPLVEIMQMKQSSEVSSVFSGNDEFSDFENFKVAETPRMNFKNNFVREALKEGLKYGAQFGTNPFKYGFVGGTDNHNGTPSAVEEYSYKGGHGVADNTPKKRLEGNIAGWTENRYVNPGSITGVWAEENTREGIFDGLKSREVYATSGTRMKVRFFGGWNFDNDAAKRKDMVEYAYKNGVPMGSDLTLDNAQAKTNTAPKFIVWAEKDPDSANLDRIQMIKGWLDKNNQTHEKIYNIVWSGKRTIDNNGKLPPVGNTVDATYATYTNTIGSIDLSATWEDPDFDPTVASFYYVRVLEIPTPRWSTYDAVALGIPVPADLPVSIQERAWASPIWYKPLK